MRPNKELKELKKSFDNGAPVRIIFKSKIKRPSVRQRKIEAYRAYIITHNGSSSTQIGYEGDDFANGNETVILTCYPKPIQSLTYYEKVK